MELKYFFLFTIMGVFFRWVVFYGATVQNCSRGRNAVLGTAPQLSLLILSIINFMMCWYGWYKKDGGVLEGSFLANFLEFFLAFIYLALM